MNEGGSDYADDGYLVKLICTVSGYRDHYDGAYDYLVCSGSAGGLVAFLVAVLGLGLGVQIIIFAIVSLALLAVTRPLAMKYFNQERQKTGAELLIGQKALVIEEIDTLSSKGRVEVRGQEWAAKTDAPEGKIPKNAIVVVEGIQGVKLIVSNGEETKI